MPADTSQIDRRNGTEAPRVAPYVGQLDRRTSRARVYEECLAGFVSDLGEVASNKEMALAEEVAGLTTLCREFRTRHLAGDDVDVEKWLGAFGHLRRGLLALGLARRAKDVTMFRSLEDIG